MFTIIVNELTDLQWLCNIWSMRMLREVMKQADIFSYENLTSELMTLPPATSSVYKIHYEYNQEILGRKSIFPGKVPIAKFCSPLGWTVHNTEVKTIVYGLEPMLAQSKTLVIPSSLNSTALLLSDEERRTLNDWYDLCQYTYLFNHSLLIS